VEAPALQYNVKMPYICAVSGCFNQRGKNSVDAEGKPINYFAFPSPIAEKECYDK